jgi:hypothetical protein
MKRLMFFLLFTVGFLFVSYSQSFFENISIPDTGYIKCMSMNSNGDIFIGIRGKQNHHGGVLRKLKNDTIWESVCSDFLDISPTEISISNGGIIYVGTCSPLHYFFKSFDNGTTWEEVTLPGTNNIVAIEVIGSDSIMVGRNPAQPIVIHTKDNGETWQCDTVTEITNNYITDFEMSDDKELYASMNCITSGHGGIYKSNDFGESWEFDGLIDHQVYSLAINSKGDLFTGDLNVCGADPSGVYCKRKDSTNYQFVMWASSVDDMVVTDDDCLYVCSDFWIYRTPDYGETIDTIFDQLGLTMKHMCIDPDGYLWCANGVNMIKSLEPVNINGVGLDNVEKSIESKLSVFPNPVRNKANVHIEADGYKKVVIYSVDGEVMRIIDEFTDNELYLDISRYTPGIYFIYVKDVDNNQYITKILKL